MIAVSRFVDFRKEIDIDQRKQSMNREGDVIKYWYRVTACPSRWYTHSDSMYAPQIDAEREYVEDGALAP